MYLDVEYILGSLFWGVYFGEFILGSLFWGVYFSTTSIAVRKLLQHMGGAAWRAAPPMCCT